ncbi:hypothetical protein AX16_003656 [Volvariella volvacea WC 439]|nr:hypothetical protein AX16_003656 [Volvariella volvacea WC 439]
MIPIVGCQTKIKPAEEGQGQPSRICPRCHNASAFVAKKSEWFELFFIPIVPLSSQHIWLCGICQWNAPYGPGLWEPAVAGYPQYPPQGWQQPSVPGYQTAYVVQHPK